MDMFYLDSLFASCQCCKCDYKEYENKLIVLQTYVCILLYIICLFTIKYHMKKKENNTNIKKIKILTEQINYFILEIDNYKYNNYVVM